MSLQQTKVETLPTRHATQRDIKKLKIITDIVKTYYVEIDGWIYGGPFDTKEEAKTCLEEARSIDAQHPIQS